MKAKVWVSATLSLLLAALAVGAAASRTPAAAQKAPRLSDEAIAPDFKEAPKPPSAPRKADESLPDIEKLVLSPWKGDFDQMVDRRAVRALVAYSKGLYFVDGSRAHGVTYDMLKQFERYLNKKLDTGPRPIHVVFCAVRRDEIIPALLAGKGDLAAGNLSITPDRLAQVDFSEPFLAEVKDFVVTGPASPPVARLEDLSGKEVYVRLSSSYAESLRNLNRDFVRRGLAPIRIVAGDENLEAEDILEMVNAGLIGLTVVNGHTGQFWSRVFDDIKVREDLVVASGGKIGWAIRKGSPKLRAVVDEFARTHKIGTSYGNMILRKYLRDTKWVRNAVSKEEMAKFRSLVGLIKRYATQYDFDYLLVGALAYQESRLNNEARSPVGAIGVMQVMPATAAGYPVQIENVHELEQNIHAGVKLLRFIRDDFYKKDPMDRLNKGLMTVASYNAGPGRISRLRKKAAAEGLNPNKWFGNVELVVAREIGRETVQYVSNVHKYYLAYTMTLERQKARERARTGK